MADTQPKETKPEAPAAAAEKPAAKEEKKKPAAEKPAAKEKPAKKEGDAEKPAAEKKEKEKGKGAKAGEEAAPAAPAAPAMPPPEPFMGVSNRTGASGVKDVPAALFVATLAKYLKRTAKIAPPTWADYVKTGVGKELSPYDPDWYFTRAAAIFRKVYLRPLGIGALRHMYGCKVNCGSAPSRGSLASGSIIRKILQQLEALKFIEKDKLKGGRKITAVGRRELDRIAKQVLQETKDAPVAF